MKIEQDSHSSEKTEPNLANLPLKGDVLISVFIFNDIQVNFSFNFKNFTPVNVKLNLIKYYRSVLIILNTKEITLRQSSRPYQDEPFTMF